jgi:hypothetical protein
MKSSRRFFAGSFLWSFLASAMVAVIGVPSSVRGIEIFIANHSFEDVAVPDGYYTVNTIPGWLGEGSWHHIANPIDGIFSGTTDGGGGASPIDGYNAAAVNNYGHILYQNLTETIQPDWTYTLTLLVGHRIGVPLDDVSVNLVAGDRFLARAFPQPAEDSFDLVTLSYHSPASGALIGQPFQIELRSAGTIAQGWFDDVHLYGEASADGTVVSVDTAYIPIPPDHPHYATSPNAWPGFTAFGGGGTLDFPTVGQVPDTAGGFWLLALALLALLALRRWERMFAVQVSTVPGVAKGSAKGSVR